MSPGLRPSKTRTANPPPGEMGGYPLPEASAGREAFGDRLGPGRPRSSSLRPDSVHRIMAAQSVKGLAVILGALIAVAFTAGGASSAANRPSGATTSRPSTTSGLKQPAPQSARPTVAPCAASMTAIAHGTFAYVEPGQLFSPATGAAHTTSRTPGNEGDRTAWSDRCVSLHQQCRCVTDRPGAWSSRRHAPPHCSSHPAPARYEERSGRSAHHQVALLWEDVV